MTNKIFGAVGYRVFLLICFLSYGNAQSGANPLSNNLSSEDDPTALQEQATSVLGKYCVSCHGLKKQEGEVQEGGAAAAKAGDN